MTSDCTFTATSEAAKDTVPGDGDIAEGADGDGPTGGEALSFPRRQVEPI